MHALVTGAGGFIGRELVRALAGKGYRVRALVRDRAKASFPTDAVALHVGDLSDESSLEGIAEGIDMVFHLGAAMAAPWDRHFETTVRGTQRLIGQCRRSGVSRFLHVSSIVVYDTGGLAPGSVITERFPLIPDTLEMGPYARGKLLAERRVHEAMHDGGQEASIVRPGLVYGPGKVLFPHLGPRLAGRFFALGGHEVLLPLTYVGNTVDAIVRVAEARNTAGETYHVVDADDISRRKYLDLLGELEGERRAALGVPAGPLVLASELAARARRLPGLGKLPGPTPAKVRYQAGSYRYDTSALRGATGWAPSVDLRRGLSLSLEGTASPARHANSGASE